MSENDVTEAVVAAIDHPETRRPMLAALTTGVDARHPRLAILRDRLLGAVTPTIWTAPQGAAGADIVVTDDALRQLLTLENKLRHGPGQFASVQRCEHGTIAPGSPDAAAYHAQVLAAISDPSQMQWGSDPHDWRTCSCTFGGRMHTSGRTEAVCAVPQLDVYAYYRDWLPAHIIPAPLDSVIHVFLTERRLPDLETKYQGAPIVSKEQWVQVSYPELLIELTSQIAGLNLSEAADAVIDRVYVECHWPMPWGEIECLPVVVKNELQHRGLHVTRSAHEAAQGLS